MTTQDSFNWIFTIVVPLIISILAFLLSLMNFYFQPRWQLRAQYKLQKINELYPDLLTNINISMEKWRGGTYSNVFVILRDIVQSGEIGFMEEYDKELYKNLNRICDEILPLINEMADYMYSDKYDIVKNEWRALLLHSSPTIMPSAIKTFSSRVEKLLHDFFDLGYYFAYLSDGSINELFSSKFESEFPSIKFETLIDMASSQREKVENLKKEIEDKFKEIIEDKVIPLMRNKISKPI